LAHGLLEDSLLDGAVRSELEGASLQGVALKCQTVPEFAKIMADRTTEMDVWKGGYLRAPGVDKRTREDGSDTERPAKVKKEDKEVIDDKKPKKVKDNQKPKKTKKTSEKPTKKSNKDKKRTPKYLVLGSFFSIGVADF